MNRSTRSPRREPPVIQEPQQPAKKGFIAEDSPIYSLFSGDWTILIITFLIIVVFFIGVWYFAMESEAAPVSTQEEFPEYIEEEVNVDALDRTEAS